MDDNITPIIKRKNVFISLFSTFFILITLVVGVYFIKFRQNTSPIQASGPTLQLTSTSNTVNKNSEFIVDVYLDTKGESVTGADLRIRYDQTKLQAISIESKNYLPVVLIPGQITSGLAKIVLGSEVTTPKNGTGILAAVKFKALDQGENTVISFDEVGTMISAIGKTTDVLNRPTTPLTITIAAAGVPINGGWSNWSPPSCPTTCGLPASTQTRTCTNPAPANGGANCVGSASQSCAATPACVVAPVVTLSANPTTIALSGSSTITWSTTGTTPTCTKSNGWTGAATTEGSEVVTPTTNKTYTLSCTNSAGSNTKSVTVTVTTQPTTPPGTPPPGKIGDVNNDNSVNIVDIGLIIDNYGSEATVYPSADINTDGIINIIDIGIIIDHYE